MTNLLEERRERIEEFAVLLIRGKATKRDRLCYRDANDEIVDVTMEARARAQDILEGNL